MGMQHRHAQGDRHARIHNARARAQDHTAKIACSASRCGPSPPPAPPVLPSPCSSSCPSPTPAPPSRDPPALPNPPPCHFSDISETCRASAPLSSASWCDSSTVVWPAPLIVCLCAASSCSQARSREANLLFIPSAACNVVTECVLSV